MFAQVHRVICALQADIMARQAPSGDGMGRGSDWLRINEPPGIVDGFDSFRKRIRRQIPVRFEILAQTSISMRAARRVIVSKIRTGLKLLSVNLTVQRQSHF
jgi:hypothetical protein